MKALVSYVPNTAASFCSDRVPCSSCMLLTARPQTKFPSDTRKCMQILTKCEELLTQYHCSRHNAGLEVPHRNWRKDVDVKQKAELYTHKAPPSVLQRRVYGCVTESTCRVSAWEMSKKRPNSAPAAAGPVKRPKLSSGKYSSSELST